jgi:hypothetical protein
VAIALLLLLLFLLPELLDLVSTDEPKLAAAAARLEPLLLDVPRESDGRRVRGVLATVLPLVEAPEMDALRRAVRLEADELRDIMRASNMWAIALQSLGVCMDVPRVGKAGVKVARDKSEKQVAGHPSKSVARFPLSLCVAFGGDDEDFGSLVSLALCFLGLERPTRRAQLGKPSLPQSRISEHKPGRPQFMSRYAPVRSGSVSPWPMW